MKKKRLFYLLSLICVFVMVCYFTYRYISKSNSDIHYDSVESLVVNNNITCTDDSSEEDSNETSDSNNSNEVESIYIEQYLGDTLIDELVSDKDISVRLDSSISDSLVGDYSKLASSFNTASEYSELAYSGVSEVGSTMEYLGIVKFYGISNSGDVVSLSFMVEFTFENEVVVNYRYISSKN